MNLTPCAKDLLGRSSVVRFYQISAIKHLIRPLLAGAVFTAILAAVFGSTAAAAATVVGTIPGAFNVSASGAATYSIPITVPRGAGGLTPQIALVYNSQSGNGMAGFGWTLSGFSAITRCTSAIYDDGQAQAVQLAKSDDYCLDGQRLRQTGGTYGGNGTYDTEIQGFSLINSYTTSGTGATVTGGPAYFTVQMKDGTIYEYGNTGDSQIFATGTSVVRVWALDKITDVNTNYITFTYSDDTVNGDYWPIKVAYTGNGATTPSHAIKLDWTPLISSPAGKAAVQASYVGGTIVSQTQLLSEIEIKYAGSDVSTYGLSYTPDAATSRNLLQSVQECNSIDGNCYPVTNIGWQQGTAGWQTIQATDGSVASDAAGQAAHMADVNGDGCEDLIYPGSNGNWFVMFGQAGGGLGSPVDTLISAVNYQNAKVVEYNGDGKADILYANSGVSGADNKLHVLEATGSTTRGNVFADHATTLAASYIDDASIADVNGHGLSDLLYSDGTSIYVASNSSGAFGAGIPLVPAQDSTTQDFQYPGTSSFNEFQDGTPDFDGSGRAGGVTLSGVTTSVTCPPGEPGCVPSSSTTYTWNALEITGPKGTLGYKYVGSISAGSQIVGASIPAPVDMNGDGLSDLFTSLTSTSGYVNYTIYIGTGNGFDNAFGASGVAGVDPVFADYYGNGRQDMIEDDFAGGGTWTLVSLYYDPTLHIYNSISQGTSAPYPGTYVSGTVRVGDTGGRGLDDLVYLTQDSSGSLTWLYTLHAGVKPDLVNSITDGLGNSYKPSYQSLADGNIYSKGSGAAWPVVDEQPALYAVSTYSFSDGTGGMPSITFGYQGLQANMTGFSLGFASRSFTDSRNGVTTEDNYDQNFPYVGLVDTETVTQSNGSKISTLTNSPQNSATGSGSAVLYNVTLTSSELDQYDINNKNVLVKTTTTTNNSFDNYGDATDQLVDTHDPSAGTDYKTEVVTNYADSTSPYCISAPTKVTVTKTNPDLTTMQRVSDATTSFDYTHCRPNQVTVSAGIDSNSNVDTTDGLSLTTQYAYDQWGNVSQTTVSGTGIAANRVTTTDYTATSTTATSGEYPGTLTVDQGQPAAEQTTETWRSDLGFETSVTDPNGHTTTNTPDGFGRLVQTLRPDGTSISWAYTFCGAGCPSGLGSYKITESVQNAGASQTLTPSITQYDSKGRVIQTLSTLLGGVTSSVLTEYDSLGRPVQVSNPHLGSADLAWTYYNKYDVLNRVGQILKPASQASAPTGATDTTHGVEMDFAYCTPKSLAGLCAQSGFVTQSTATDHTTGTQETTSKITDALGELTETVDAKGGKTQYTYDPFGDLVQVQSADNRATSLTYDGVGNKVAMTDPDMGHWSYSYDALGELLNQTDAKNQQVVQGYDALGRVTSRTEYDQNGTQTVTDTWCYDGAVSLATPGTCSTSAAAPFIGQPASVSDTNGYSKVFSYDSLGRPSALDTSISGTDYQMSTGYDSFGRVATVTYPQSVSPNNSVPVASATATPTSLDGGGSVTLDGSGSTDPNGDPLQYIWSVTAQPTGSNISLTNPNSVSASATLIQGGNYTFQLQVQDANAVSTPTTVSVTVLTPPSPTGVGLSPNPSTNGNYTLSWTTPSGTVSGFYVYESSNGASFAQIGTVPFVSGTSNYSYPLSGKGNGTYKYYVIAYNGAGPGAQSSTVTETVTLPPAAPTSFSISAPNPSITGNFTLSWTAPAGPVTSYQIWLSTRSGTTGFFEAYNITQSPLPKSQLVSGAANGTYWYHVIACNGTACGSASNTSSITVLLSPGAPGLTANFTKIASGGNTTLSWNKPSGTVTYYNLSKLDTNTNGTTTLNVGNVTSYLETLTKVDYFDFNVQACNSASCGGWSNTVEIQVGSGCKNCSQTAPTGGTSTAPSGGTTSGPVSFAAPVVISPLEEIDAGNPTARIASLPPRSETSAVTALAELQRERKTLTSHVSRQPLEALMQAEAYRRSEAGLIAIAPRASAREISAWEKVHATHDPKGPDYAAPTYLAYGGAKVASATGSPYQFTVRYDYDTTSGALTAVQDANTGFVYWQADTGGSAAPVDGFGHILGYTDGNNVDTVLSYDTATGTPLGIGTTGSTGPTFGIQQLAYNWDGFGNLSQRCDANKGLVEQFTYDELNRLSTSAVTTGVNPCPSPTTVPTGTAGTALSVTYDPIGDITCKQADCSGGQTYVYGDSSHPHAVTSVNGLPGSYAYDADGNLSCRDTAGASCSGSNPTANIAWNVDNLPTTITGNGGTSTFSYGPDRDRYQQGATDASGNSTSTTYIAGGLFQVVTVNGFTSYRHDIVAGGGTVAVHTIDQTGKVTTDYLHSDHIGSADVITDEKGNIATDPVTHIQQVMSFDAFGQRRDPNTWGTLGSSAGLTGITNQGYTAQEQLDNVGLVHMNGRVYDPTLGRMVSADPTIPNFMYSQAFNRYAYVYNNPLSAIDPSGFEPTKCSTPGCDKCIEDCIPSDDNTDTAETGSHIPGVHTGALCGGDCGFGSGGDGGDASGGSGGAGGNQGGGGGGDGSSYGQNSNQNDNYSDSSSETITTIFGCNGPNSTGTCWLWQQSGNGPNLEIGLGMFLFSDFGDTSANQGEGPPAGRPTRPGTRYTPAQAAAFLAALQQHYQPHGAGKWMITGGELGGTAGAITGAFAANRYSLAEAADLAEQVEGSAELAESLPALVTALDAFSWAPVVGAVVVGAPLMLVGAVAGLAVYGGYELYENMSQSSGPH